MSIFREAWLCAVQGADGNEETEFLIELTNGARITCTQPANMSEAGAESVAAKPRASPSLAALGSHRLR